jgi:urea transport system permease protein
VKVARIAMKKSSLLFGLLLPLFLPAFSAVAADAEIPDGNLVLEAAVLNEAEAVVADAEFLADEIDPGAQATGGAPLVATLLRELAEASLNQTPAVLAKLEEVGGRALLPLFEAMLAGELYYNEDTFEFMRIIGDGSVEAAIGIPGGEELGLITARDMERVRLNNRLRTVLRASISRVTLTEGNAAERRSAARTMLGGLDANGIALLREAAANESDDVVLELIAVGVAMYELGQPGTDEARLEAIKILDGRLENPVRNLLASIRDGSDYSPAVRAAADLALRNIAAKVRFYQLVEQLFFGLSLGSVLLLAAIGLAITFGVMGVINMAHGEMLMLGAYSTYVVQQLMPQAVNYSILVALPVAFVVAALTGILIQRYVIRYLNGRPLETLLAAFGISLILQQAVRTIFSPLNRRVVSPDWLSGSWQYNEVLSLTSNRLCILGFSLLVFAVLLFILNKTSLGLQVRAVSQNRAMAKSMGIRTDRVDALTFGLGSGIAGIAGVALSQLTNVGPNLGQGYIIDSFMVVVFGGVGNLFGTLLAAFSLGVANKFLEPATGAVLANILILVFIILFIQKRPKGLFPQKGRAAE